VPYSVAQHSIYVCDLLPDHLKLQGLLHDASEACLPDFTRPLKLMVPELKACERRVWAAIAEHFSLPPMLDPLVKEADNAALAAERRDIMAPPLCVHWPELPDPPTRRIEVYVSDWRIVRAKFLSRYRQIMDRGL